MFRSYSENICRTDPKSKPPLVVASYTCDVCEESNLLTEMDLELHRKDRHFGEIRQQMNNNKDRFCTICMKMQDNPNSLIAHIKSRHLYSSPQAKRIEREIYICDYCSNIFFNKDTIIAHIKYTHMYSAKERNSKTFICPTCRKVCQLKSIWFHMLMHEIPSVSTCDICMTSFPNSEELMKHLESHPLYYKCEICCYHTNSDVNYNKHLDQHQETGFKTRALQSALINAAFRKAPMNISSMMVRYNIHHSLRGLNLPRLFNICTICREICTEKNEMKEHIMRDHHQLPEPRRLWRCACGLHFTNQILLKHHVFKLQGEHRHMAEIEQAERNIQDAVHIIKVQEENAAQKKGIGVEANENETTVEEQGHTYIEVNDGPWVMEEVGKEATCVEGVEIVDIEQVEVPIDGICIISDTNELTYVYKEVDEDQIMSADEDKDKEVARF